MTYADAMNILDRRREGADMPLAVVERALELTRDMDLDPIDVIIAERTT